MSEEVLKKDLLKAQKNELTEYIIYTKLSQSIQDQHNKTILKSISREELNHHNIWRKHTQTEVKPSRLKI